MRPTRWYVLTAIVIVAGGAGYLITWASYDSLPTPTLYAQISLVILALVEAYTASITKARLEGRPGTRPIEPMFVARLVALAKASSIAGALAMGAYAGFLGWVSQLTSTAAHTDVRTSAVGVAAGALLVAGALYLERVGRVREDDDSAE